MPREAHTQVAARRAGNAPGCERAAQSGGEARGSPGGKRGREGDAGAASLAVVRDRAPAGFRGAAPDPDKEGQERADAGRDQAGCDRRQTVGPTTTVTAAA